MSDPADNRPEESHPNRGIETLEHLIEHLREIVTPTMAIVCVGNELCGDDAAAPLIAEKLTGKVPWKVYNTQTVPESFLMKIISGCPQSVLLIDALDFAAEPGSVEMFATERIGGQGPSTHGPAPLAFLEILNMMHPCRCAVLGIQPQCVEMGKEITSPVAAATDRIVEALTTLSASPGKTGDDDSL
jgi:hydrogenase 3 maturation protease